MAALPYNLEAEAAVIGSALVNRAAAVEVAPWLAADAFYDEVNRTVWAAMLAVAGRGETPNLVTIARQLHKDGAFERVGGIDKLSSYAELPAGVYSENIAESAHLVENAHLERRLLQGAQHAARIAADPSKDIASKLSDAQRVFAEIQPRSNGAGLAHIGGAIATERARVEALKAGKRIAQGVATQYRDLDEITGGLQPTDLIILAARPSVGKTSMALSLAYNIANRMSDDGRDQDVVVFSLEMGREQLTQRLVSMHSRIDTHRLRTLHMSPDDIENYVQALDEVAALPVFLDDAAGIDLAYIRHKLYAHVAARGTPAVVMIDYLQLMAAKAENRVQEVSAISRGLKNLAKEFRIPVIALSQLSRAVEGRTSHVPMLSDLRESGSIEQDADQVWFLYREELYDKETDKKGTAEIHIAKHRNGPIGVFPMRFDAATTRFDDLTYRTPDGY